MDLNLAWFLLLGLLLAGYAVLDGFDLGVGILHLTARTDAERRTAMAGIAPVWDGNEVWLVTFGAALFAAFPHAYATILPAFYLPVLLLLAALILRGAGLEFRNQFDDPRWRAAWDAAFFAGSLAASLILGIAAGNLCQGLPMDKDFEFAGDILGLLRPFPVLTGLLVAALFAMHGALYLHLKTEGAQQQAAGRWFRRAWLAYAALFVAAAAVGLSLLPAARGALRDRAWGALAAAVVDAAAIAWAFRSGRTRLAFFFSAAQAALLVALLGLMLYPALVPNSLPEGLDLDLWKAASSPRTLALMLYIAVPFLPLVMAYSAAVHWVFRGKVRAPGY
jgi:cytochrome d ubiquinol oxidase subunit II